ncbi:tetratricopeptide repeat protein [Streptomyces nanshensis]|uniref:tetratricopeptide repeat protein n=1 Tax=Streptomyces nanshensis TaxID=518642 RepID=UPI00085BD293|nr:tetratricopeptide repeat protein [Streptomyces nanshensis]
MVPGLGAFAGAVDPHQIAVGADRLRAMLSARFRNQDDVQLVLSPLHVLTPVLLEDLHEAAQRTPWITLFFDTYERTGPVLDVWLRDVLFTERYGSLPANVLVVLAGQNRLDTRCWGDHLEFVTDLPLEVFTESEARQLLSDKGVSDERTAQVILRLSGRLPVLLSTLAESRPAGAEDVGDPSGTAVERFLKWESDPARRAAALACALPQELDEDVYRAAAGGYAAQGFGWLRTLPFINDRGGRCTYHDVVRTAMLRLQRTASPRGWQEQHGRLAAAFRAWRLQLQDGDPDRASTSWWDEARWREYRLQETYHLLCADERTALPGALRELLDAYDHGIGTLRRWVRTLARAGDDTTAAGLEGLNGLDGHGLDGPSLVGTGGAEPHSGSELAGWGRRLSDALEAEDGAGIAVLTLLLTRGGLDEPERARALTLRALDHHAADSHERALADFDAALALTPDDVEALHGRGRTYLAAHRDDEALADFDRVLALDPDDPRALAARGVTLSVTGRHEEALTALDRAVDAVPDDSWTITARAATNLALERHPEALADGDRAVALDPEYALAFGRRGAIHWAMGHHEEALADFSSAIGLHPEYIWALGERGEANRLMGRHREALADFSRAVELDPEYDWALASRGQTHRIMDNYPEALTDFDRALAVDPAYAWALSERGEVNRLLGRHREALTDFDRALELAPDDPWALASRGQTHRTMGNYPDALADFDRALELAPEYGWALSERGEIHRHLGHHEEALADFDHALELEPGNTPDTINRALTYAVMGRHDEAAAGFDRALEILATEEPATEWDALRAKATAFAVHCVRERWERAAETFEDFVAGAPDAALRRDAATDLEMLTDVLPSLTERIAPYRRRLTEQP